MSIAAGIAATKATLDVVQKVTDLIQRPNINAADVQAKLHELLIHAVNAQAALGEAQEQERALTQEIYELRRRTDFMADLIFEEGVYWKRDYPYCPNCCDVDHKPMRLDGPTRTSYATVDVFDWECPIHKSVYCLKKRAAHT